MEIILKNNQTLIIREASPDDAVELNKMIRTTIFETDHFGCEADEYNITDEQQAHTLKMYAQAENSILLVAIVDGKIVGNIAFRAGSTKKFQHTGEFGMEVLKAYWNLGIGKELIKHLIEWGKENKYIKKISLRVRDDNASAIHVYKKLGFKEEGILRNEMMTNGVIYDLIYMGILV